MHDIVIFTRQDVRCWYEISYDEKEKAIILRIHEDFINAYRRPKGMLNLFKKIYEVDNFLDNFNKDIGYEGIIKFLRKEGEFSVFSCALPVMKKLTEEVCPECNGSKVSPYSGAKCLDCSCTGKKFEHFPKITRGTILSLTTIFKFLGYFLLDKNSFCSTPLSAQLMEISMETKGGEVKAAIGAELSPSMVNWLLSLGNESFEFVPEEMIAANKHMNGGFDKIGLSKSVFKAEVNDGRLSIHCSGNAAYINTDSNAKKDKGYVMGCHNVDYSYQQLLLLIALAMLHDRARAEIQQ